MNTKNVTSSMIVYGVLGFLVVLSIVYFVGIVFEFQYPYALTLSRVRGAVTMNGKSAMSVIASSLGVPRDCLDIHTCSYCIGIFEPQSHAIHVQINIYGKKSHIYHFAYDRATNILVPATQASVDAFGQMLSSETKYVATGGVFGNDRLLLPEL